ncbi:RES domain-containing protein [Streptomyces lunaelactis]|uniref:RES domain-containing protein n=1 Tax=Streptomyces lunaelactis TaxID=1535768 RepID=UPI00158484E5|nr:RES domain-containing protein [Streptomyces lunaelactis]NUK00750.1 RES domain-containing protein [Streptomyces lunaelactis]NUK14662.1 RES domain-containing protein [Streptomyces lunaelactis]
MAAAKIGSERAEIVDQRPFIDVEDPASHAVLTEALAVVLATLGADRLDVPTVRGCDRRVTRAVSQWIHDQADDHGRRTYAGVRYLSKIDSTWECWAVFDDTVIACQEIRTITRSMPEIRSIQDLFGILIY